ncbi:MAG: alpha/beta fold hydrolase [Hyphomicrobium sp.]
MRTFTLAAALFMVCPAAADPMLADFDYPHAVALHAFVSQSQSLEMAYMDVKPLQPNGRTVVFLHGKNFCGATWERAILAVVAAGYRAVVPDQIGFCKSSKPEGYAYGFHELAANTRGLLASLGIARPILVGHSMGGMLAMRYGLSFPEDTGGLVLVNPIGLEDWRAKGVPERTLDELVAAELKTSAESIRAYQLGTYYGGQWKPEYDRWVEMLASMYAGDGGRRVAAAQAHTSRMVFSDPVVHELERLAVPVTLIIGEEDITAIGRDRAAPEIAKMLGNTPALAREAAARIPDAKLVTFSDLGHSPQVQDPAAFNAALLEALKRRQN